MENAARKSDWLEALPEQIAGNASTRTIFGEPIHGQDTTVIPVAKVRYGFGAGSGSGPSERGQGSGGVGGMLLTPLGFIELHKGKAKFRRIFDAGNLARVTLGVALSAWVVLRGLRKLRNK
ncbi:MAG: GerW family sporulation protein [Bdellovibrionota bacterium]